MNSTKSFLLVLTLLLCCSASLAQQPIPKEEAPKGWKEFNAQGYFTFYMPANAWLAFTGLDEYSRDWRIGKLAFMFIHQPMGVPDFNRRETIFGDNYREAIVEIDGRKAYLINYSRIENRHRWYYVHVFVGDWPNMKVNLELRASSTRPNRLEVAKKIFGTVRFLKS